MNHQTILAHIDLTVSVLDQRLLPHVEKREKLESTNDCIKAIAEMWVRGAPLIGITAAFGMAFAAREAAQQAAPFTYLKQEAERLAASRPTAVNLAWLLCATG